MRRLGGMISDWLNDREWCRDNVAMCVLVVCLAVSLWNRLEWLIITLVGVAIGFAIPAAWIT